MQIFNKVFNHFKEESISIKENATLIFSRRYDLNNFKTLNELTQYLSIIIEALCINDKENYIGKNQVIKDIIRYVERNFQYDISLQELANQKYFMNYSYLSRLFKEETGISFTKYLINFIIQESEKLLNNLDFKISEIALQVGYNDVSHYIQSFKKSKGSTPEEYRCLKNNSNDKKI